MNDNLAQALLDASNNASALELICTNDDDADKADAAQRRLLFAAMEANAADAIRKLGTTVQSQQNLKKLTDSMKADTRALAQSEANVTKFVSLGTAALSLTVALAAAPIDVAAGITAVRSMLSTLGR